MTNEQLKLFEDNQNLVYFIYNKLYSRYYKYKDDIEFGTGISKMGEIIDYGTKFDIIDKSGSWFSYKYQVYCLDQ